MRCYAKFKPEGLKMKKSFLFFYILFCAFNLSPVYGQWSKTYIGDGNEGAYSVVALYNQGYIVAGTTNSWGAGATDFYVLKLKNNGKIGWQKTYGGFEEDSARAVIETRLGNYIVTGETYSFGQGAADFWVLKLMPNGSVNWQKTLGGPSDDVACSVTQAIDGGYAVAGYTSSFGRGLKDIWLIKLSKEGEIEWQKTYGGKKDDAANCITATLDGGFIVCGYTESFGRGGRDIWILKLDGMGDIQWQKSLGQKNDEEANCIQQTLNLGFVLCGWTDEGADRKVALVVCLTDEGKIDWQHRYALGYDEIAYSIRQTRNGRYYWLGGESAGGNAFVIKLNKVGTHLANYSRIFGSQLAWDGLRGMDLTSTGGFVFVGTSSSWCTWSLDLWLVKAGRSNTLGSLCAFHKQASIWSDNTFYKPRKVNAIPIPSSADLLDSDVTPQSAQSRVYNLCRPTCTLTIAEGEGGTIFPSPGVYEYPIGEIVQLNASPHYGMSFHSWVGNVQSTESHLKLLMDGDKNIKATFTDGPTPPPIDEWGGGGGGGFTDTGKGSSDQNGFNGLVLFATTILISLLFIGSIYVIARRSI